MKPANATSIHVSYVVCSVPIFRKSFNAKALAGTTSDLIGVILGESAAIERYNANMEDLVLHQDQMNSHNDLVKRRMATLSEQFQEASAAAKQHAQYLDESSQAAADEAQAAQTLFAVFRFFGSPSTASR